MSLASRLSSALRSATRSPAVRRGVRGLGRAALRAVTEQRRGGARSSGGRATVARTGPRPTVASGDGASALADRTGTAPLSLGYAPRTDAHPDPGEIVWAWVPFEEDLRQGKDRPVLVIAEEPATAGGPDGSGDVLIALMLTSRDRAPSGGTATDEHGATWVDIGSGDWDSRGRPSEVRADRLLRLAPQAVRRAGGRLDRARYDRVAEAVDGLHSRR
jgi:hypothetical protein